MPRLRAILFDIDGTLLDTRDAWVAAFDAGLAAIRKASISGSEAAQWIGTPIEVQLTRPKLTAEPLNRCRF